MAGENSYATIGEVQAHTQLGPAFSTTTKPTLAEVQGFMDSRGAEVYGWIAAVAGAAAPGPVNGTDYQTDLSVATGPGYALGRVAAQANAMLAAADALQAAGAGESPARSERVSELMSAVYGMSSAGTWVGGIKQSIEALALQYVGGSAGRIATHVSEGDVVPLTPISPTPYEQGLIFTAATQF